MHLFNFFIFLSLFHFSSLLGSLYLGTKQPFAEADELKSVLHSLEQVDGKLFIRMTDELANKILSKKSGVQRIHMKTRGTIDGFWGVHPKEKISGLLNILYDGSELVSFEKGHANKLVNLFPKSEENQSNIDHFFALDREILKEILTINSNYLGKTLAFADSLSLKEALKNVENSGSKRLVIFIAKNLFQQMFTRDGFDQNREPGVRLRTVIENLVCGGPRVRATVPYMDEDISIVSFGEGAAKNLISFFQNCITDTSPPHAAKVILPPVLKEKPRSLPKYICITREKPSTSKYTAIDLFSGSGGTSHGFHQASFDILAAIDFDEQALGAFQKNFPQANCYQNDIDQIDPQVLLDDLLLQPGELTCLLASPPCQPFSRANGCQKDHDKRRDAYTHVIRYTKALRPKWVVIENIGTGGGIKKEHQFPTFVKEKIAPALEELGYTVEYQLLDACDYGVPQIRKRYILIAHCHKKKFEWPDRFNSTISVEEALSDLALIKPQGDLRLTPLDYGDVQALTPYQEKMRRNSPNLALHCVNPIKEKHFEFIMQVRKQIEENGKPFLRKDKFAGRNKYRILLPHEPSIVVTCYPCSISSDSGLIHYEHNRKFTPRELARLQGFPDTFIFEGSIQAAYKQIGNAVPPPLAYALALQIIETEEKIDDAKKRPIHEIEVEKAPHPKRQRY